jgi:hypothetical protein
MGSGSFDGESHALLYNVVTATFEPRLFSKYNSCPML